MNNNATLEMLFYQKTAAFVCAALDIENDIDEFLDPYLLASAEMLPKLANWAQHANKLFWGRIYGPFLQYLGAWILIHFLALKVPSLLLRYWPHDLPELEAEPLIPFARKDGCMFSSTSIHEFRASRRVLRIQEDVAIANVTRKVHVTRGTSNQRSDIVIHIETGAARLQDCNRVRAYQIHRENAVIITGAPYDWSSTQPHPQQPVFGGTGGYANITVYIRPGARFYSLIMHTMQAPIEMSENVSFDADSINLTSLRGDIACARAYDFATYSHINAGHMSVTAENNSNIIGEWPLTSKVTMESHAGDIRINLKPWRYAAAADAPSTLNLRSSSGDLEVKMPILPGTLAFREYKNTLHTQRGSIRGVLPHNRETFLTTDHGSIDVTLLPFNTLPSFMIRPGTRSPDNIIRTKSLHGNTRLRILDSAKHFDVENPTQTHSPRPEAHYDLTIDRTKCRHQAGIRSPGSLWLQYSGEWVGYLKGRVLIGSISVNGSFDKIDWRSAENDERIEDERKKMYAWRGDARNTIKLRVGSGDAHVTVGSIVEGGK